MLVCYFLPITTYLKYKYTAIHLPEVTGVVKRSTFVTSQKSDSPTASPTASFLEVSHDTANMVLEKDYGTTKSRKKEFIVACVVGTICCSYAVYVFFLQLKGLFGG